MFPQGTYALKKGEEKYGTGFGGIWFKGKGGSSAEGQNMFHIGRGTGFSVDGNVGIGTNKPSSKLHVMGTITETSDERLKENIIKIESSLDKISQIDGVSFDWKDEDKMDDRTHLGLIAQDVEEIFPELVYTSDDEIGTKSVNYDGMIAPLLEAVKELKVQNELQQKEIELLKSKIQ